MEAIDKLNKQFDELVSQVETMQVEMTEYKKAAEALYKHNLTMKKNLIIDICKKLAKEDVDQMEIETTAEGRSALKGRYEYWSNRIK